MQGAAEKYLMLLSKFSNHKGTGTAIEVTTEEVANALFCTPRNAKLIIHKLVEAGLIHWLAGRGRGNVSRLTFLGDKDALLVEWAQEMSLKGEYKQAFELLQTNSVGTAVIDRFVHWLNDHFGYQAEQLKGNQALDTLRFPVYNPLMTMDPSGAYCAFDTHIIRQVFDRLVEYDYASGTIVPSLAHAWESNSDATEWTFHLRKGIRFHHGRELRLEDVGFTFERLKEDKPHSWLVRELKEIQYIGSRTIRILLNSPNYIFIRYVSSIGLSIIPQELVEANETSFWQKPVGTGPFRFVQWTQDFCELLANVDYYLGRAHLDRVVIAFMPEETAKFSENAHWQLLLQSQEQQLRKETTGWDTLEDLCNGCMMMSWNMGKKGPQQAYGFRKAIDLLLNRKEMIRQLGDYRKYPARGFRPTVQTAISDEVLDVNEARRLLKDSGYNGEELILCAYHSYDVDASWIERRCAEFGINVKVQIETIHSIRNPNVINQVDGLLYNLIFAVEEVCEIENYEQSGNFLKEHLHPHMQEWIMNQINTALASPDPKFRRVILDGIENRLREEAHVLFILHKKQHTYVHSTVKGVGLNSLGWMDFKEIWLENATL